MLISFTNPLPGCAQPNELLRQDGQQQGCVVAGQSLFPNVGLKQLYMTSLISHTQGQSTAILTKSDASCRLCCVAQHVLNVADLRHVGLDIVARAALHTCMRLL